MVSSQGNVFVLTENAGLARERAASFKRSVLSSVIATLLAIGFVSAVDNHYRAKAKEQAASAQMCAVSGSGQQK